MWCVCFKPAAKIMSVKSGKEEMTHNTCIYVCRGKAAEYYMCTYMYILVGDGVDSKWRPVEMNLYTCMCLELGKSNILQTTFYGFHQNCEYLASIMFELQVRSSSMSIYTCTVSELQRSH